IAATSLQNITPEFDALETFWRAGASKSADYLSGDVFAIALNERTYENLAQWINEVGVAFGGKRFAVEQFVKINLASSVHRRGDTQQTVQMIVGAEEVVFDIGGKAFVEEPRRIEVVLDFVLRFVADINMGGFVA